jgi:digeranylgeranylglycerophospholipid reductase
LKVAIIGSGVSGLACAFRLNQLGIKPTIFEKRSIIGEAINLYGMHLNCFNLFTNNPLKFFEKEYNLKIAPMRPIKKITMYSGNKKITVKGGNLGCIFKRGPGFDSLERQLFDKVDAFFCFDVCVMPSIIDEIRKEFDAVVVATGGSDIPKHFDLMKSELIIQVRSGLIEGRFEPCQVFSWMKTGYSNDLYVYLIPVNENRAVITLLADDITPDELDYKWKKMIITENITNKILQTWDDEYRGGRLKMNQLGNLYFIGNAGGLTDDFMGFGIINGIISGIFAADAIVKRTDYQKSIQTILDRIDKIHNFKLLAEKSGKDIWKYMTGIVGFPGIRGIIYRKSLVKFYHIGGLIENLIKE